MLPLKRPHALLLDMDGVLVDSEALHWETVMDVLRAHLSDQVPYLKPRIGWGDDELWTELRDRFDLEASVVDLTTERGRYALKRLAATPPSPMPLAVHTLQQWRLSAPNLPLVVVSASPRDQMIQSLTPFVDHTAKSLFNTYISGIDDVVHNKPKPDPYLRAISQLGLAPEVCWIVEDSATGLMAALASGAQVISIGADDAPISLKQKCHLNLNSLNQLYDVWKSLS